MEKSPIRQSPANHAAARLCVETIDSYAHPEYYGTVKIELVYHAGVIKAANITETQKHRFDHLTTNN